MAGLILLAGLLAVIFLLWRLVSPYVLRTPVDNLPGPPSGSLFSGNMAHIFARDNKAFLTNYLETYGPVAKLHGFLGARWVHVYDPKALYSVHVKDQDSYSV